MQIHYGHLARLLHCSIDQALTNAGLIMKVSGTTASSAGNVVALSQDRPEGTEVPAGTVVTVQFGDNSVLD